MANAGDDIPTLDEVAVCLPGSQDLAILLRRPQALDQKSSRGEGFSPVARGMAWLTVKGTMGSIRHAWTDSAG